MRACRAAEGRHFVRRIETLFGMKGIPQMPFPRTWTEELIAEWLQLDGFLTQTNLPVCVSKVGGRFEADVVGARIKDGKLEIQHIETGLLAGGLNSTASIKKKFAGRVKRSVTAHFKRALSFDGPCTYRTLYVASFWTRPVIRGAAKLGVKVIPLPEFIRGTVLPTVREWKRKPPFQSLQTGPRVALPESLWLLQMLDHLKAQRMLGDNSEVTPR